MSRPETAAEVTSRPRSAVPALALQAVLIVALLLALGAACGLLWSTLWDPPRGVVRSGEWLTGETGLRAQFAGTGWYVVVALPAGLLAGLLVGLLLARAELWSLVVLLVAAGLGGWLMREVGLAQSPPDPQTLAAGAADGTVLPGALRLAGRAPLVALPLGAMVSYALVLLALPGRRLATPERDAGAATEPELPPS